MRLSSRKNVVLAFICMRQNQVRGTRNKQNLKNKKFLSTLGFKSPRPALYPVYESIAVTRLLSMKNLNVHVIPVNMYTYMI